MSKEVSKKSFISAKSPFRAAQKTGCLIKCSSGS
eukprot:02974.XXX_50609_50710_1 [CDS] Oithona nana genome sequencing.